MDLYYNSKFNAHCCICIHPTSRGRDHFFFCMENKVDSFKCWKHYKVFIVQASIVYIGQIHSMTFGPPSPWISNHSFRLVLYLHFLIRSLHIKGNYYRASFMTVGRPEVFCRQSYMFVLQSLLYLWNT